jgi:WD40 repeat protein
VALPADGQWLASGSDDGTVRLSKLTGGDSPISMDAHTSTVHSVAVGADGRLLASGSGDGNVRVWDVASGTLLSTLHGHASTVFGVALSADGQFLASGSGDGTVRLWDTASGECLATLRDEPCYDRLDITGLTGVTDAQRAALLTLGAVEQPVFVQ